MSILIESHLAQIRKELERIAVALEGHGAPATAPMVEYALGHKDGVAWCRKALSKAIEERGREFAVDFLDEYLK